MFKIKGLTKKYSNDFALQNITMKIEEGMNFIIGSSGSGKTTLLKILCGFEKDFEGSVAYCKKDILSFTEDEKSALFNHEFGFVWQDFHLLEDASVYENMMLPTYLKDTDAEMNAKRIIKQLKLEEIQNKTVKYLSGGQKQRVAIARELMKNPKVIFCDEPTSALDEESAKTIMNILHALSKHRTVIVVTHDTSFIREGDTVYELDKGELISAPKVEGKQHQLSILKSTVLSLKGAYKLVSSTIRNNSGRFILGFLSLFVASTLLLTSTSGTIEQSGQEEFDKLVETYGEGILDIGLVGKFMSAAGGAEDKPSGSVDQNLNGLYEKYENDERVEFIVSMQPFENIKIELDNNSYTVEKTGNSPVLTKMLSGNIPSGDKFQVVLPIKFVEQTGFTKENVIGKEIDFHATVFQWINDQPIEKPIHVQATVCGVADNTVVYDYEGKTYQFTVDDSFFFNRAAIEEIRKQAQIEDKSANFTIRTKTPEDLIALKDELNKSGIVPLGRFELVEDIVRLNQQTASQTGSASTIIAGLAIILVLLIFAMTSLLRKREYAIYKLSGYKNTQLLKLSFIETTITAGAAILFMIVTSPLTNMITKALFHTSILSITQLLTATIIIVGLALVSFLASVPFISSASVTNIFKVGNKS